MFIVIHVSLLISLLTANSALEIPILPERYFTNFKIFYTPSENITRPPWPNLIPPSLPYVAGTGSTWYAADLEIVVEEYQDFCVPIFNPLPYFPCTIFNFKRRAYLISPAYTIYGPCCIYQSEWEIPKRDFMKEFAANYNGTTKGFGLNPLDQKLNWWTIFSDDSETIFGGYAWSYERVVGGEFHSPVNFWYVGEIGWAQQLFFNFTDSGKEMDALNHFQLPASCKNYTRTCEEKLLQYANSRNT